MKSIITAGTSVVKGNITNIIVSSDSFNLIFDSTLNIVFEKKNYDENRFMAFMNLLKNVNVNARGVFYINVPRGTVEQIDTVRSNEEYNSIGGNNYKDAVTTSTSKPLIDGVFTQEPQGAVDKLNKKVVEQYKTSVKNPGVNAQAKATEIATKGQKKENK